MMQGAVREPPPANEMGMLGVHTVLTHARPYAGTLSASASFVALRPRSSTVTP